MGLWNRATILLQAKILGIPAVALAFTAYAAGHGTVVVVRILTAELLRAIRGWAEARRATTTSLSSGHGS